METNNCAVSVNAEEAIESLREFFKTEVTMAEMRGLVADVIEECGLDVDAEVVEGDHFNTTYLVNAVQGLLDCIEEKVLAIVGKEMVA